MTLWRLHLRPESNQVDPVQLCIRRGVVGIGWPVSRRPADRDEYWALGSVEYGNPPWSKAVRAIACRMSVGDLVWVRDFLGQYHLGRITGGWEYRDEPEYRDADIVNVRPCKLYPIRGAIPGQIVRSFIPSATLQQINDDTAKLFSILTYNELSGEMMDIPTMPSVEHDMFSLLLPEDLEDIVGLYLQSSKRYFLLPSSRSRNNSTMGYEYQLIHAGTGEPAYVQVKSGGVQLDPADYYESSDQFYLFSPAGYVRKSEEERIVCITRPSIKKFMKANTQILPRTIATWLAWSSEESSIAGDAS